MAQLILILPVRRSGSVSRKTSRTRPECCFKLDDQCSHHEASIVQHTIKYMNCALCKCGRVDCFPKGYANALDVIGSNDVNRFSGCSGPEIADRQMLVWHLHTSCTLKSLVSYRGNHSTCSSSLKTLHWILDGIVLLDCRHRKGGNHLQAVRYSAV